jgi:hypothetical protein
VHLPLSWFGRRMAPRGRGHCPTLLADPKDDQECGVGRGEGYTHFFFNEYNSVDAERGGFSQTFLKP